MFIKDNGLMEIDMGLGFRLIHNGLKKKENGKMESLSIE
jgi:hypothetical protein